MGQRRLVDSINLCNAWGYCDSDMRAPSQGYAAALQAEYLVIVITTQSLTWFACLCWLQDPKAMPAAGPTLVLGYMKQFRAAFSLGAQGELMLAGRQVSVAINDRFVLNTLYQFDHRVDLNAFMGHNACFTAGADKVGADSRRWLVPWQALMVPSQGMRRALSSVSIPPVQLVNN
jgi:hypothetical protein